MVTDTLSILDGNATAVNTMNPNIYPHQVDPEAWIEFYIGASPNVAEANISEFSHRPAKPHTLPSEIEDFVAELEFNFLTNGWKKDTWYMSSPIAIAEHPSYQAIVGKGQSVLPMILRDLEDSRAQWFVALRQITGESPVQPEERGNIDAMTSAWLAWGKERQYI